MVNLLLLPASGNKNRKFFPHSGYLALSPVHLHGVVKAKVEEDKKSFLASSISVSLRCVESRLGKLGVQRSNVLAEYSHLLWSSSGQNDYEDVGDSEFPFKITVPVDTPGLSMANLHDWKVTWKIEAMITHTPMFGSGTRTMKTFEVALVRYDDIPLSSPFAAPLAYPDRLVASMNNSAVEYAISVPSTPVGPLDQLPVEVDVTPLSKGAAVKNISLAVERRLYLRATDDIDRCEPGPSSPPSMMFPVSPSISLSPPSPSSSSGSSNTMPSSPYSLASSSSYFPSSSCAVSTSSTLYPRTSISSSSSSVTLLSPYTTPPTTSSSGSTSCSSLVPPEEDCKSSQSTSLTPITRPNKIDTDDDSARGRQAFLNTSSTSCYSAADLAKTQLSADSPQSCSIPNRTHTNPNSQDPVSPSSTATMSTTSTSSSYPQRIFSFLLSPHHYHCSSFFPSSTSNSASLQSHNNNNSNNANNYNSDSDPHSQRGLLDSSPNSPPWKEQQRGSTNSTSSGSRMPASSSSSPLNPPSLQQSLQAKMVTMNVLSAPSASLSLNNSSEDCKGSSSASNSFAYRAKFDNLRWPASKSHALWAIGESVSGSGTRNLAEVRFFVKIKVHLEVLIPNPTGSEEYTSVSLDLDPRELHIVPICGEERKEARRRCLEARERKTELSSKRMKRGSAASAPAAVVSDVTAVSPAEKGKEGDKGKGKEKRREDATTCEEARRALRRYGDKRLSERGRRSSPSSPCEPPSRPRNTRVASVGLSSDEENESEWVRVSSISGSSSACTTSTSATTAMSFAAEDMRPDFDTADDKRVTSIPISPSLTDLPSSSPSHSPKSYADRLHPTSSTSYLSPFPSKQHDAMERGRAGAAQIDTASRSRSLTRDALSFLRGRVKDAQRIHRNVERSLVRTESNVTSKGSLFPLPSPTMLFKKSASVSPAQHREMQNDDEIASASGFENSLASIAPWAKKGRMRSRARTKDPAKDAIGVGEKRKRRASVEDEA